jgi:hypothetical protein
VVTPTGAKLGDQPQITSSSSGRSWSPTAIETKWIVIPPELLACPIVVADRPIKQLSLAFRPDDERPIVVTPTGV